MTTGRFYVTTSIPYVNGAPHLGHALELVQADVLARHRRRRGRPVRFLTGTDDNALKNVAAARAAGVPVRQFVDANAARFVALRGPLALSVDDVIRTSADPRHAPGVRRLWERCAARGDFYRRRYTGLYCAGCEQFYAPDELAGGHCPEHGVAPEEVSEENWFFRLSRYQDQLERILESGAVRVEPATKRAEVLAFVRAGLHDLSVSRPADRAGGWGIPVPGDPSQVVYVWWDAVANYVTALGYGSAADDDFAGWWAGSADRVHVVGKGIVRFHAVYWLAQLLSAGLPLPTAILVHDYLTVGGAKIAKSTGVTADPAGLARRYGTDALRWWFVREVPRTGDTDFTEQRLVARHDLELANGLGNLVQRTLTLVHRLHDGVVGAPDPESELVAAAEALPDAVDRAVGGFDLRAATAALVAVVDLANRTIEADRPWERDRRGRPDAGVVLAGLVHACRVIAAELEPFLPGGAARLRAQLAEGERVGRPEPAFHRLDRPKL
ncbi:methionine--tRNA ligase [Jiangella rhizosphaerae]|uniref:methionine--tRNA ligase n=1 Tax=Jiangella rhizosphaerae TaxID=2293569 RepID=A0A418KNQ7_9ACTN|nr:methionine--tRNA ligase [Jiangella rhizosphaerae]RIQ20678.1 methionine--tRNA ligase [Jiangella rhizosphaerae]